jgi:hypothetical protein
MKEHEVEGKR